MSTEEIAGLTGLSSREAAMAKERHFDEPFIFEGEEADIPQLLAAILSKGFRYTQGAFYHILGDSDKGKAVSILEDLYRKAFGEIVTIGLGDSPNDIPMLERVDYPVIVQKPSGEYDQRIQIPNLIKTEGAGPEGWNNAILSLVQELPGNRLISRIEINSICFCASLSHDLNGSKTVKAEIPPLRSSRKARAYSGLPVIVIWKLSGFSDA